MNEWDSFDCSLATSLSELPPPESARRTVSPCRAAVIHVLLGFALTGITFRLWQLDTLLPAIGCVEMYLGFRALRRNNRFFYFCWIISVCKAILFYASTLLLAMPLGTDPTQRIVFPLIHFSLLFLLMLLFHLGLRQAAAEVGHASSHAPMLWAMVWNGVLLALAFFVPNVGILGVALLLIAYGFILRSLYRVGQELEEWGYGVRSAPTRVRDLWVRMAYLGTLLILTLALCAASNHLTLSSQPLHATAADSETAQIREQLLGLGFPESQLSRLSAEEIDRLDGAIRCTSDCGDTEPIGSRKGRDSVRFDTVYVQLDATTLEVYEFFEMMEDTLRSNWKTLLQLEPSSSLTIENIRGCALWQKDGQTREAVLSISDQPHESLFFGSSILPSAYVSYPFFSSRRGGYLAYTAVSDGSDQLLSSILRVSLTSYSNFYPCQPSDALQTDWYTQSYSTCEIPAA